MPGSDEAVEANPSAAAFLLNLKHQVALADTYIGSTEANQERLREMIQSLPENSQDEAGPAGEADEEEKKDSDNEEEGFVTKLYQDNKFKMEKLAMEE